MKRLLVIQPAFLGDAVLTLALLGRLREAYPHAELHWLLRAGNESLFAHHPWQFHLWVWDKSWKGWVDLYRALRQLHWDAIIVVQRFLRMGLLGRLLPAQLRITYDKNPLSIVYSHRLPHRFGEGIHEVDRLMSLGVPLGLSEEPPSLPWLFPSVKVEARQPYVVVSPTSRWRTKEAPLPFWEKLLCSLPERLTVYLTGLSADRERIDTLVRAHPRAVNLAGQLSLPELAALTAGAERVYTVDSAITHIASALGVPTTTVFCSTVPAFGFGPLAPQSEIVEIGEKLSCRPCNLHGRRACPQGHFRCGWGLMEGAMAKQVGRIWPSQKV